MEVLQSLLQEANAFENNKMSNMSMSDRVKASRVAKRLILSINEFYKENKDPRLMNIMKQLTEKKRKIEVRLKGRS